jgi:hypothetical protein
MDKKKQKKKIARIKTIKTPISMEMPFKKIKHNYIFQIGFNRCATQAINNAFEILGLKTIHHSFKPSHVCPRQYLAILMYNNLKHSPKKKIIQHELADYECFTDMEYVFQDNNLAFYTFFKEMEEQNIGSTFVMNIRSCESWILSRIKLGKKEDTDIYFKEITLDKLKSWVEHYFNHSHKVREYFRLSPVIGRSKFYVLPLEYKTVTDLMREMGLYNGKGDIVEKVDFAKNKMLNDEEKKLPESIIELIKEKIKISGDPSTLEWWYRR